jgi:general secretion pathway protein J
MQRRLARPPPPGQGFTLVEVLVALLIMAILAGMAWQGLDGILRSRQGTTDVLERSVRLNTVLTQWEQDLQAVQDVGVLPSALSFDGQSLRLTRRMDGGIALVVWAVRSGQWQRWVGPTATKVSELSDSWLRSQQLLGTEAGQVKLADASEWNVYFYRGNAWTNAQSTGDLVAPPPTAPPPLQPPPGTPAEAGKDAGPTPPGGANPPPPPVAVAPPREALPGAVRLVITLGNGVLTRDIALGPSGS